MLLISLPFCIPFADCVARPRLHSCLLFSSSSVPFLFFASTLLIVGPPSPVEAELASLPLSLSAFVTELPDPSDA